MKNIGLFNDQQPKIICFIGYCLICYMPNHNTVQALFLKIIDFMQHFLIKYISNYLLFNYINILYKFLLNILFVKKILNFQINEFFSIISYKYKIDPK